MPFKVYPLLSFIIFLAECTLIGQKETIIRNITLFFDSKQNPCELRIAMGEGKRQNKQSKDVQVVAAEKIIIHKDYSEYYGKLIKHGHCLLIGESVFFEHIGRAAVAASPICKQKTQTSHVSIGSDCVLYLSYL